MVGVAFCIGGWSLFHGFRKHHHRMLPFALFSLGICLLIFKLFFIHYETWLLVPAVVLIVSAHFINYRMCRVHDHGHDEDCDH